MEFRWNFIAVNRNIINRLLATFDLLIMDSLTLNGITYSSESLKKMAQINVEIGEGYLREFWSFIGEWFNDEEFVVVSTSGSTGKPKRLKVLKQHMINSAELTCRSLGLVQGDNALLCLSTGFIAGKMMVVRAIVAGLNLTIVEPCGTPFIDKDYAFCAMVPMQVYNILSSVDHQFTINQIGKLIIGGGAVSSELRQRIEPLTVACYSTYGMTETVSHIALRRLNGPQKQQSYYPLEGITVSTNSSSCLVIDAPGISPSRLVTNDIAEIEPDGSFKILGRLDNVINSGGIKIIPEVVESKISGCTTHPYAVSSIPDARLGEMVVLVVEGEVECIFYFDDVLTHYERPKKIIYIDRIPQTSNGKIDRVALRLKMAGY